MVGFVQNNPTTNTKQQQEERKQENIGKETFEDQSPFTLDPELEDLASSFSDSFLDFDFLKEWAGQGPQSYDMADLVEDPLVISPEKIEPCGGGGEEVDFGAVVGIAEVGNIGFGEKVGGDEGGYGESLSGEKGGYGVIDKESAIDSNVSAEDVKIEVEEGIGDNCGKLGDLMEKVNLDGSVKHSEFVLISSGSGETKNGAVSGMTNVPENIVENGDRVNVNVAEVETESESESDSESGSDNEPSPSSSSSSSSSEDEEESEEKGHKKEGVNEEEVEMEEGEIREPSADEMVAWSGDEEGDVVSSGPIRSRNELEVLPPVPPVEVTLQPHHQTLPVGAVLSRIGAQVIVEGVEKHNPLSEGSILWITESRCPLGIVDEIFGPVKNPYYIVRYNSENDVPAGVQQGSLISFVSEFANYVLNNKDLYRKGYDASGENDEELSDEVEFSDDEKEAEYKKAQQMKKRGGNDQKPGNKRKGNKKFTRSCNSDQGTATQAPSCAGKVPADQGQHIVPAVDQRNFSSSAGLGQAAGSGAFNQQFISTAQVPAFGGIWANGVPPQHPQIMGLPNGLPTNGYPWLQNHPQHLYQMSMPGRVPFQQQIGTSPMLPPNFGVQGGQSNFGAGPAFTPWPANMGPNLFNQPPLGMALPAQNVAISMNPGGQVVSPNGQQMGQINYSGSQPPKVDFEIPRNFNHGIQGGGGRKPQRRGGGRFSHGRGRHQHG